MGSHRILFLVLERACSSSPEHLSSSRWDQNRCRSNHRHHRCWKALSHIRLLIISSILGQSLQTAKCDNREAWSPSISRNGSISVDQSNPRSWTSWCWIATGTHCLNCVSSKAGQFQECHSGWCRVPSTDRIALNASFRYGVTHRRQEIEPQYGSTVACWHTRTWENPCQNLTSAKFSFVIG